MMVVENDAVNVYYGIHIQMVELAMMRIGMAKKVDTFILNLLEKLAHYMILGGITTGVFVRTKQGSYIDSTGHGTGCSPVIWMCLFDVVLTAIAVDQIVIYLKTPNGSVIYFSTVDAYVDDSRQAANKDKVENFDRKNDAEKILLETSKKGDQVFERNI